MRDGEVALQGLLAHGRGEAFDYLLGEKTIPSAKRAIKTAAAFLLLARNPVISVNGNTAALVPQQISRLALTVPASVEVNLFHRTLSRERRISRVLHRYGVKEVLGVGAQASERVQGLSSARGRVDPRGIGNADVVLVPLEDGDRTIALRRMGVTVMAIDLNPLSRTAREASVTIVDNITRALPLLVEQSATLKNRRRDSLHRLTQTFNNVENLSSSIQEVIDYLERWKT